MNFTHYPTVTVKKKGLRKFFFMVLLVIGVYVGIIDENTQFINLSWADVADKPTLNLDFKTLSSQIDERQITDRFSSLRLECNGESSQLSDRVCWADINAFNGVPAHYIEFFFKESRLTSVKIALNGRYFKTLVERLKAQYGKWKEVNIYGNSKMGWYLPSGILAISVTASDESTAFWVSHEVLFAEAKTGNTKELKEDTSKHFFINCYNAFTQKEFSTLSEFYDRHTEEPKPDKCFRLNNNEFLVTVTDTGRIAQGLYLIDIKQDKIEMEDGYLPNIRVAREFLGKNKKRYVLLSYSNLHAGYWSNGYFILNLIPKTNKGKPYILYSLLNVSEDPVSGLCGEKRERFIKEGENAETVTSYKILNEDTEDVTLIFYVNEENCKTLKKRTYTKKFKLAGGIFKLIE